MRSACKFSGVLPIWGRRAGHLGLFRPSLCVRKCAYRQAVPDSFERKLFERKVKVAQA
mgnify:CR=1 FL=1